MSGKLEIFVKKAFVSAVISAGLFFTLNFALDEVLINRNDFVLEFSVDANQPIEILCSYKFQNVIADPFSDTIILSGAGKEKVSLALPPEKSIEHLYFTFKPKVATFEIEQMTLKGALANREWTPEQLLPYISTFSTVLKGSKALTISENGNLKVSLDLVSDAAQLDDAFASQVNNELNFWPNTISVILTLICFICILSFLKNQAPILSHTMYTLNFSLVFLLVLFIPFISQKNTVSKENRLLAPFPELNQLIWKIPNQFNKYYNDHFPFRNELDEINNRLRIKYFNTSPMPDHVGIGKEGWLFNNIVDNRDKFMGLSLFTPEQLDSILQNLEEKRDWLALQGIDFYFLMPPFKHEVYPEYLPARMKARNKLNKRMQVVEHLKKYSNIKLIDPFEILMEKKDSVEVFYKTDTHWNELGSFFVYHELMKLIHESDSTIEIEELDDYVIHKDTSYTGDLLDIININQYFYRAQYHFEPKKRMEIIEDRDLDLFEIEQLCRFFTNKSVPEKRLMVFHDSYCLNLIPYLNRHYSYSSFSWSTNFVLDRITAAKPDIVIFEMMHMHIEHLLDENPEEIKHPDSSLFSR